MAYDRRTLLTDASTLILAGTVSSAAASAVAAAPARGLPVARVASIAELAKVDPQSQCVDVLGFGGAGDAGGGLFVWRTGALSAGTSGPRIASKITDDGYWMRLTYEGGSVRPEWFGSLTSADDHAALVQAAIDFISAEGGGRVDLGNARYRCKSRIVVDPTKCVLSGNGATLDFSLRPEPSAGAAVVDLDALKRRAGGSWSASGNGLAHRPTDITDLAVPVSLEAGQRYRLTCKVDELAGDPNIPFVRFEVLAKGIEAPVVRLPVSAADSVVAEFQWPADAAAGRLVLASNSEARISAFSLEPVGTPECLLVRAGAGSAQYGHLWIEGIRVQGRRGDRPTRLQGIRFETPGATKSSRAAVRDLNVEGFDTAVVLADRAYLIHFFNCRLIGDVGVQFLHGRMDAGENISFHGCTIGGGKVGVWNGGAELNLFATSINFVDQFYVGLGQLNAQSCHFETTRTTRPDQYLFDVSEGAVNIDASYLMVGGGDFAAGNEADYIVYTRSPYAAFTMSNASFYNLRTRTGVFAGGAGRFQSRNLSGIAMNPIAPLPKDDARSNLFGPAARLDDASMGIDYRLVGGQASGRESVQSGVVRLQAGVAGEAGVIAVQKTGAAGDALELWLLAPCVAGNKIGWAIDAASGRPGGRCEFKVGARFVQLVGRDEHGAPLVGSAVPMTQRDTEATAADTGGWSSVRGSSFETRYGDASDGSAPAFATHVALRVDATKLQAGDELLLRLPYAGVY